MALLHQLPLDPRIGPVSHPAALVVVARGARGEARKPPLRAWRAALLLAAVGVAASAAAVDGPSTPSELPMQAFLDRRELLRLRPDDGDLARLAAYDLLAAGAPGAAMALVAQHPRAVAGEAGAALARRLAGDLAARHIRWGWDEPVFDPARRRHEAQEAIAALEPMHRADPEDLRAARDLLLAYRLADRTAEAIALWETMASAEAPYWARNAAADAYLAERQPRIAEALYRSIAVERASEPAPWLGIYWAAIEQRHFDDAEEALQQLAKVPGQELSADIQRGWLLLYSDRAPQARRLFASLWERHPGDARVRSGLATADVWQGSTRRGLRGLDEVVARTTSHSPTVDNAAARLTRAGALSTLGDLGQARREAVDLATLYPQNAHAQEFRRTVDAVLSPAVQLAGRYDTSDRGLGEAGADLEVSTALGTRARFSAGVRQSRSEDDLYSRGDVRDAYVGATASPSRWLRASAEVAADVAREGWDRRPAWSTRISLLPDDSWRIDAGYTSGSWRDLPLRARAIGLVADTFDLGVRYAASPRWNGRAAFGRSQLSDGNVRRWGLLAGQLLVRQGPTYSAHFGVELYGSDNSRSDVVYYSPSRDRSVALTHRSEWIAASSAQRRHTFAIVLAAGAYDQAGFAAGPVGSAGVESAWDLSGSTALVLGAGARSQLYDGSRELDPRLYVTVRRRF
jgi:biofilm PGA synthesis protein PgaA